MMAVGAAMGISQGAFVVLGGRLESFKEENDEFERKEILRRTTRVPIEDTIKDLGEQSRTLPRPLSDRFRMLTIIRDSRSRLRRAPTRVPSREVWHRGQPRQCHHRGEPINHSDRYHFIWEPTWDLLRE